MNGVGVSEPLTSFIFQWNENRDSIGLAKAKLDRIILRVLIDVVKVVTDGYCAECFDLNGGAAQT